MFKITQGKGFHIVFENGINVSVQFGYVNYCDNRDKAEHFDAIYRPLVESTTAEVMVWDEKGKAIRHPDYMTNDNVGGWLNPKQVLEILNWAASLK